MTSQGSAYARFRRALERGNLLHVRAAAAELPQVPLEDVLEGHEHRDILRGLRGGDQMTGGDGADDLAARLPLDAVVVPPA